MAHVEGRSESQLCPPPGPVTWRCWLGHVLPLHWRGSQCRLYNAAALVITVSCWTTGLLIVMKFPRVWYTCGCLPVVYACVSVCTCVPICVCTYACLSARVRVHVCQCARISTCVHASVCTCVSVHVCQCARVCMCALITFIKN